jgi:FMN-dependent NADH-azoreductase
LVKGKKVYVALASGGIYSEGPWKGMDFVEPYLRSILGFIGLTDVTFVRVEGLNIPEVKDSALEKAIASILVD